MYIQKHINITEKVKIKKKICIIITSSLRLRIKCDFEGFML